MYAIRSYYEIVSFETKSLLSSIRIFFSFCRWCLFSFQLFTCNANKMPIITRKISPIAYLKYWIGLLLSANCFRITSYNVCYTKLLRKGFKVIPWTLNDDQNIEAMIDYEVDGIISDYPDKVMKIIAVRHFWFRNHKSKNLMISSDIFAVHRIFCVRETESI